MKIKKNFIRGRLNKDVDERLLPNGEYRDAQNIVIRETEGSDEASAQNPLGNEPVSSITFGANPVTLFELADDVNNAVIWFVHDDTADEIFLYDDNLKVTYSLLRDSRTGANKVLNFDVNYPVDARIIYDSDNSRTFLVWVDGLNEPRMIEVDRVKNWAANTFDADDITLLRPAPLNPPTLELYRTISSAESILEERIIQFATQYKYDDEQYSALSPFSEVAFEPGEFNYDYATTTNLGMANKWNAVNVNFDTGPSNVKGIRVIFKEPGSSTVFLVEELEKEAEGFSDDVTVELSFSTDKYYTATALRSAELNRLFDDVPTSAQTVEVVANRIILGNCNQGADMLDVDGEDVNMDFNVYIESTAIADNLPVKSLKSNRTVEAGIVYLDSLGRKSPVFTSKNNTDFIPNSRSNYQNKIRLSIANKAPAWATHYQIFLKDSRDDYEVITPLIFYQTGRYVWIKLEGNDVSKVAKGDSIYVKASSKGLLDDVVRTEILEVETKERNFLEDSDETSIKQVAGVYMKLKPEAFSLNSGNISVFDYTAKGFKNKNIKNDVQNNIAYYDVIYDGTVGLDDITVAGTYIGTDDIRYIVEITTTGTPDSFRWSDDNGASWTADTVDDTTPIALTGSGLTVVWGATTGHDAADYWIISAKAPDKITTTNDSRRCWVPIKGKTQGDEAIKEGAQINIEYTETRDGYPILDFANSFTSSDNYENIEEWFFGDQIYDQMDYPFSILTAGGTIPEVSFRRGTSIKDPTETISIHETTGDMYMLLRSSADYIKRENITVIPTIEISELDTDLIFETVPGYKDTGIFYEWGEVFEIDANGYHQNNATTFPSGNDQSVSSPATIEINIFDCFAWSNGYESYKIGDKLTGRALGIDTKPWSTYPNFRLNKRTSSLIFSGVYEQSTNVNRLNEFNSSLVNYKDLDDKEGKISALLARDTDLLVWQEDKVSRILINKSVLYNADGTGNVSQNNNILGQEVALTGEYGLRVKDHRSVGSFGNWIWWPDSRRGVVCRLGGDGINEISKHGMRSWFRNTFRDGAEGTKIASYDPYHDQYILALKEDTSTFESEYGCGSILYKKGVTEDFSYKFLIDPTTVESWDIDYDITAGSVIIRLMDSGETIILGTSGTLTGSGTFSVTNTEEDVEYAVVQVLVQTSPLDIKITNNCTTGDNVKIKAFVVYGEEDNNDYRSRTIEWFVNIDHKKIKTIQTIPDIGTVLTKNFQGLKSLASYPDNTDTVYLEEAKDAPPGAILLENGQGWYYLVTQTEYSAADVDTIITAGTALTVSNFNYLGVDKNEANFVYTEQQAIGDIIYLVFDYRSISVQVIANNDSVDVYEDNYIDIDVLDNDEYTGTPIVTITSSPTNGTARVLSDNKIRYRNNGTTGADSITYQLANNLGSTVDTAVVSIDVLTQDGGGTGATGRAFLMSSSGAIGTSIYDGSAACGLSPATTRYHNGANTYPTLDDYVYTDVNKTTAFDGDDLYYKVENSYTIKITPAGRIIDVWYCGGGGGGSQ